MVYLYYINTTAKILRRVYNSEIFVRKINEKYSEIIAVILRKFAIFFIYYFNNLVVPLVACHKY